MKTVLFFVVSLIGLACSALGAAAVVAPPIRSFPAEVGFSVPIDPGLVGELMKLESRKDQLDALLRVIRKDVPADPGGKARLRSAILLISIIVEKPEPEVLAALLEKLGFRAATNELYPASVVLIKFGEISVPGLLAVAREADRMRRVAPPEMGNFRLATAAQSIRRILGDEKFVEFARALDGPGGGGFGERLVLFAPLP